MPLIPPKSYGDEKEELWSYFLMDLESMVRAILTGDWSSLSLIWILLRTDWRNLWKNVESYALEVGQAAEDWINEQAANLWINLQLALEWVSLTWDSLGDQISSGWYTAVSWAEAKALEVHDSLSGLVTEALNAARSAWTWVSSNGTAVWDWIRDKSSIVWNWQRDKAGAVWDFIWYKAGSLWDWFTTWSFQLEIWYTNASAALDRWRTVYMPYYMDLFDDYRDDLLDLLETGLPGGIPKLLLSEVEKWLYDRWFGEVA